MKRLGLVIGLLSSAVLLSGCHSYPTSKTVQGISKSSVFFAGFPDGAIASINGEDIGFVSVYNGSDQVLALPTGTHTVSVFVRGQKVFDKKVYVGAEGALQIQP